MTDNLPTFNDLPQVVAGLRDEVSGQKALLLSLCEKINQQMCEKREPFMSPEQLAEYIQLPLATIYQKLESGEIPAFKPGKRWRIKPADVDMWLESCRRGQVVKSDDEINNELKASMRHKAKTPDWANEGCHEANISNSENLRV